MTDWRPPLLGNKQPRPMGKGGETAWFANEIRKPGSRPRTSDELPKPVEGPPPAEPPLERSSEAPPESIAPPESGPDPRPSRRRR